MLQCSRAPRAYIVIVSVEVLASYTDATMIGGMAALTALAGALTIGTKRRRERRDA